MRCVAPRLPGVGSLWSLQLRAAGQLQRRGPELIRVSGGRLTRSGARGVAVAPLARLPFPLLLGDGALAERVRERRQAARAVPQVPHQAIRGLVDQRDDALARAGGVGGVIGVVEIVGVLEGDAERWPKRPSATTASAPARPAAAPISSAARKSAAVFSACSRSSAASVPGGCSPRSRACPRTIPRMPAPRASAPRRPGDNGGRPARCARLGDPVERQRQQRVAGQDRGRLAEHLVVARPPAPEVVVVHRRQIVVDQRVAVDQLDRRAGEQHVVVDAGRPPPRPRPAPAAGGSACPGASSE